MHLCVPQIQTKKQQPLLRSIISVFHRQIQKTQTGRSLVVEFATSDDVTGNNICAFCI